MLGKKILLIGWDAADWKIITPLINQGKMPNLKRLMDNGTSGNLSTLQPVLSPTLWTSIATGKRPFKHGVHGFTEPDPITGGIRPVTNLSRKTKAIWNILNQEEKSTITVGWWPSNPAEELSKGVMVSNDYQRSTGATLEQWPMKKGTVHPSRLQSSLKELRFHPSELEESDIVPFLPAIKEMNDDELKKVMEDSRLKNLQSIIADCTSIHSAATALMQNEPWELMCVYYDAIDHFGHAFMKYHPPQRSKVDDWDFKLYNYCTEAGYLYHDMMLGTLLELAGDEATVMLISDHGFHPDDLRPSIIPREPAGPAIEHRQFGIFAAMGPGIKKRETLYGASLLDISPTLLHYFGLPVGEDMDGKVLDVFDRQHKVETIPSWDLVEGDHGMHSGEKQISAAESKAALEQLVALGYIDEPNKNQSTAIEETVRELDYNLAQAYIDGGIYSEASVILERLYEQWPMEHRFGFQLTTCYKNQLRYKELRLLVEVLIQRRIEEAESAIQEIKNLNLNDEKVVEAEAAKVEQMTNAQKEKFSKDRKILIGKSRPNLYSLRYLEAYVDYAESLFTEALEKLDVLDSDVGAKRNALCLRGDIYSRLKKWTKAYETYKEALSHDIEYPPALKGLARVAIAQRKFNDAVHYAEESTRLLYFQPRAHYLKGVAYYRKGKLEQAESAFMTCIKQAPLFAAAYKKLADISRYHRHDAHAYKILRERMMMARKKMREIRAGQLKKDSTENDNEIQTFHAPVFNSITNHDYLNDEKIITIVTGLPRSGTSLMMQMLRASGLVILTDGKRDSDESNPKGYFEHELVGSLMKNQKKNWLLEAQGKVLKVVAPLLSFLPQQLQESKQRLRYRVVFMQRDMGEILHSQEAMLERLEKGHGASQDVSKAYTQQVIHAVKWCNHHQLPSVFVNYNQLISDTDQALKSLNTIFTFSDQELTVMKSIVDPSLYRSIS